MTGKRTETRRIKIDQILLKDSLELSRVVFWVTHTLANQIGQKHQKKVKVILFQECAGFEMNIVVSTTMAHIFSCRQAGASCAIIASSAWQINSVHCPYQGTPKPLWTTPLMTVGENENIWKEKEERQKGVKACITAHLAGLPDRGGKR